MTHLAVNRPNKRSAPAGDAPRRKRPTLEGRPLRRATLMFRSRADSVLGGIHDEILESLMTPTYSEFTLAWAARFYQLGGSVDEIRWRVLIDIERQKRDA